MKKTIANVVLRGEEEKDCFHFNSTAYIHTLNEAWNANIDGTHSQAKWSTHTLSTNAKMAIASRQYVFVFIRDAQYPLLQIKCESYGPLPIAIPIRMGNTNHFSKHISQSSHVHIAYVMYLTIIQPQALKTWKKTKRKSRRGKSSARLNNQEGLTLKTVKDF